MLSACGGHSARVAFLEDEWPCTPQTTDSLAHCRVCGLVWDREFPSSHGATTAATAFRRRPHAPEFWAELAPVWGRCRAELGPTLDRVAPSIQVHGESSVICARSGADRHAPRSGILARGAVKLGLTSLKTRGGAEFPTSPHSRPGSSCHDAEEAALPHPSPQHGRLACAASAPGWGVGSRVWSRMQPRKARMWTTIGGCGRLSAALFDVVERDFSVPRGSGPPASPVCVDCEIWSSSSIDSKTLV